MAKMAETTTTKLYMHKDAVEGNAFVIRMKAAAFKLDDEDVKTMITHDFDATKVTDTSKRKTANTKLYYTVIDKIGNESLINTLGERFPEDGCAALKYISECWSTGSNEDKIDNFFESYMEKICELQKPDVACDDMLKLFNELRSLRAGYSKSDVHKIADVTHAMFTMFIVSRISPDHREEVRRQRRTGDLKNTSAMQDIAKVEGVLEGVITYVNAQRERKEKAGDGPRALKTAIGEKDQEIAALKAQVLES